MLDIQSEKGLSPIVHACNTSFFHISNIEIPPFTVNPHYDDYCIFSFFMGVDFKKSFVNFKKLTGHSGESKGSRAPCQTL